MGQQQRRYSHFPQQEVILPEEFLHLELRCGRIARHHSDTNYCDRHHQIRKHRAIYHSKPYILITTREITQIKKIQDMRDEGQKILLT